MKKTILQTVATLALLASAHAAPLKVAAVEFNSEFFEFEKNIPRIVAIVEEAARAGAKIIVLPETATSGYIGKYRKVGLNPDDQLWFTPGNLGYPVFETKHGRLAMEICYDDTDWEIERTASVKGAQIVCFMSSSDRALKREPGAWANHSTISAVQEINAWNGVVLIATDRNNSESNPTTGLTVYYGGIASITSPLGKKIAQARAWAEASDGETAQNLSTLANQQASFVVGSFIEQVEGKLHATAILIDPEGRTVGTYRKTHLDAGEKYRAAAGDRFSVYETSIGRIGLLLGGEARFPEASGVLSVKRADIIALPSSWRGQYGTLLQISPDLFAARYPANTMAFRYAIAKTAQAYTVVANYVGGEYRGSSGLFTLNPVDADSPPVTASSDQEEALAVNFTTLADPDWWMSQQNLIAGRRVNLLAPLTFPTDIAVFKKWQATPGFDLSLWAPFQQSP